MATDEKLGTTRAPAPSPRAHVGAASARVGVASARVGVASTHPERSLFVRISAATSISSWSAVADILGRVADSAQVSLTGNPEAVESAIKQLGRRYSIASAQLSLRGNNPVSAHLPHTIADSAAQGLRGDTPVR